MIYERIHDFLLIELMTGNFLCCPKNIGFSWKDFAYSDVCVASALICFNVIKVISIMIVLNMR